MCYFGENGGNKGRCFGDTAKRRKKGVLRNATRFLNTLFMNSRFAP
jgi:hypothetical protein